MSLVRKIVCELEIDASAERLYKFLKKTINHIPNVCPHLVQNIKVHEGDWDTHGHGSIKIWNCTVDGKAEVFKEQVEFVDEKFLVTLIGLEGDVFKLYKTFKGTIQVVPKGPNHCLAIHTLEYEKLDDGNPCPYKQLNFMNNLTKDIASHLKNA